MNLSIRTKDLSKIGYIDNVARSIATMAINKHCKHRIKQEVLAELADVLQNPAAYAGHEKWGCLSEYFCPQEVQVSYTCYKLRDEPQGFKCYGNKNIEHPAKQQMEMGLSILNCLIYSLFVFLLDIP